MFNIKDYIKFNREKSKITNERQLVVRDFLEKVNAKRKVDGYKPYSPRTMGVRLAHIKTSDLRDFYKVCEKSTNFTRCFEGMLKIKK